MSITEEEAKTKWCPFTRVGNEAGCNRNGDDFFAAKPNCIGSACMAWNFESPESYDARVEAWEDAANIGGPFVRGPCPAPVGFCGLTRAALERAKEQTP